MEANRKIAVIAGGTSGIGLATAGRLLEEGHSIFCVGKTELHKQEALKELGTSNDRVSVVAADLADEETVKSYFEFIRSRCDRIDVMVNSIGTISGGGIEAETVNDWDRVISNNLRTVFLLVRYGLPLLKRGQNPSIVNVSSVCSLRPCTSLSYSVSKAGIDMFTKCVAREIAKYNIRVNSVNPSVVESNLQKSAGLFPDDESYNKWVHSMKGSHPLGRVGQPMDVVEAILFLASNKAEWITGAVLSVDGGRSVA